MAKEMLINVSQGEECRIALVENGRVEELYMERSSSTSHVGNIYKGKVTNVEPSIQAAFVDFGLGRNGFLHISDLMPTYFGNGEDFKESVGRKLARRDRPPIQRCLRRGDDIIVQIIKEGIGTKGPTLTTYLSIPGRILVMMPGMSKLGVSRKIEDEEERRRLRQILDSLKPPRDYGFIIRTAGVGKSKADIQKDLNYLTRLGQNIEKKRKSSSGPVELYTEGDLVTRTVRDVFTPDIERIIIDNEDVANRVKDFIKIAMPRTKNKVELHADPVPLFHKFKIESEIEQMYSRTVPLPSGGSLVIDSTEAVVAIDVNSGKFRDHSDAETTAFKTDLEAADEIPRQLRLRDLGGVIICDFIDLRFERHRRDLEKKLQDNLHKDRAKTRMLRMSQFGIIEMTRQRMRPSLKRSIYCDCPHCKGAGLVKTPESMALDVMRRLAIAMNDSRVNRIELAVSPEVAFYLQNRKRSGIVNLETRFKKNVIIRPDASIGLDILNFELYDARDGLVFLAELGMVSPTAPGQPVQHRHGRDGGKQQGRHHRDQRDERRGGHHRDEERHHDRDVDGEDRFDIELVEDAVDQREEEQSREIDEPPMPMDAPAELVSENQERENVPQDSQEMDLEPEDFEDEADEPLPEPVQVKPVVQPKPQQQPQPKPQQQPQSKPQQQPQNKPQQQPQQKPQQQPQSKPHQQHQSKPQQQPQQQLQQQPKSQPQPQQRMDSHKPTRVYSSSDDSLASFRGRRGRGRGRGGPGSHPSFGGFSKPSSPVPTQSQPPALVVQPSITEPVVVATPPAPVVPLEIPHTPAPVVQETPVKEEKPKKRGGRKPAAPKTPGAKRGRKPKAGAKEENPKDNTQTPGPMVIRPSAADKHLLDEPVMPPPIYKPRTYRDLDHIPDDLD